MKRECPQQSSKSSTEPGCCVSGLMVIGIESKRVVIK